MAGKKKQDHKEASADAPKSEPEPSRPYKEADQALQSESITTPEPLNLLPYAIGIGVAIGVGSVVLRKKGAN